MINRNEIEETKPQNLPEADAYSLLADVRAYIKDQLENLNHFESKNGLTEYGKGFKEALDKVGEHFS
jgi:hypothetical protein